MYVIAIIRSFFLCLLSNKIDTIEAINNTPKKVTNVLIMKSKNDVMISPKSKK
jgi:hypothetical protein